VVLAMHCWLLGPLGWQRGPHGCSACIKHVFGEDNDSVNK
jgi:hypothetical protein